MANIVLLTAGGVGSRTQQCIPKQFLSVNDKPIIIYTMETFQSHSEIDKIVVVCLEGWENCLESYAKQFNITKLEKIILGGKSGFESITNGLNAIKTFANKDDIILIHDGNRPCTSAKTISDCIQCAKENGNAITGIPVNEVVFNKENSELQLLNRDQLIRTQTPHAARLGYMSDIYDEALKKGLQDSVAFCSLLYMLHKEIFFVNGSEKNFKITYSDDIDLFKGMVFLEDK